MAEIRSASRPAGETSALQRIRQAECSLNAALVALQNAKAELEKTASPLEEAPPRP